MKDSEAVCRSGSLAFKWVDHSIALLVNLEHVRIRAETQSGIEWIRFVCDLRERQPLHMGVRPM